MQVVTRINEVRTSTRKVRIVADQIRGLSLDEARDVLSVVQKRGATDLDRALKSAIANAVNNSKLDKNSLIIKSIDVNEGTFFKRFRPSTRGRIHPYKKRTSNIRIVLEEKIVNPVEEIKKEVKKSIVKENPKKAEVTKLDKKKKGDTKSA
jgi:large subunit ribosomal protein L22